MLYQNFAKHIRKHTGERPYVCKVLTSEKLNYKIFLSSMLIKMVLFVIRNLLVRKILKHIKISIKGK